MTAPDITERLYGVLGLHTRLCVQAADEIASLRHQLQDMTRERDIAQGSAEMHRLVAQNLAAENDHLRADLESALGDAIRAHDKLNGVHDSARAHRDRVRELEAECASLRAEVEVWKAAAQAKSAAPAMAAGWKVTPYEPTGSMIAAAHEIDPALPIEHIRRLWWLLWRAAPSAAPSAEGGA